MILLNGSLMNSFIHFVRLTRPLNLLIIVLTMVLMRFFVLSPVVEVNDYHLQLSLLNFCLLVLSTVLIAAAGNVINDYFDQRTDRVNKPKNIIVGVHVKRRVAMLVHQVFNFMGLALAVYVAMNIGMWKLSIISFFAAGSLWFYSVQFKKELFIGNILIALMAGLVPLLVGLYEIPLLIKAYGTEVKEYFNINRPGEDASLYFQYMFYFILSYSGFAFLLTLIREIQKDIADVKGDSRINARTVPLVFGIKNAKKIVAALILVVMVFLVFLQQMVVSDPYSLTYLFIAIFIPLLFAIGINHRAVKRGQFIKAGNMLKLAMLSGILYSLLHYYIYYFNELS